MEFEKEFYYAERFCQIVGDDDRISDKQFLEMLGNSYQVEKAKILFRNDGIERLNYEEFYNYIVKVSIPTIIVTDHSDPAL